MLIMMLGLLTGACGRGGGNEQGDTETPQPTPVLEGASKELIELLGRGTQISYKITYRTASPEGEPGDSYVIFNRPPQTRIDTISAGSVAPSSLIIGWDKKARTISCAGGPSAWRCDEIEPLGDSLLAAAGPIIFLSPADVASFPVSEAEERTVAGQATRCFQLSAGQEAGGPAEYCLNADGVALFTSSQVGTVEASAYSMTVSDADFEPPAQP
jgi:hypothetical protein